MRLAGLLRVSTRGQAESGYSLPEQEARIREWCERHGHTLAEVASDEGVSGTILERAGPRRVLELAQAGAIEGVVLCKLDRLGRSNRVIQTLLHQFRQAGLSVQFTEHGSGDSSSGRLLLNVLGATAEYEWEEITRRTRAGRLEKARTRGLWPGYSVLYGYRMVTRAEAAVLPEYAGRDGELLPVPEEVEVVRALFARYDAGESLSSLARWLNAEQVPSRYQGRWYTSSVRSMLRQSAYAGRLAYLGAPVHCPALVPADLWERVQGRLDRARDFAGRPSHAYLLRGAVFCGGCTWESGRAVRCTGKRTTRNRQSRSYEWRYYVCPRLCGATARADRLEAQAREALLLWTAPGALSALLRERATAERERLGDTAAQGRSVRRRLERLDGEERRIADLLLSGISPHIVTEKLADVQRQRAQAHAELRALEERGRRGSDLRDAARRAEAEAREMRRALESGDPEQLARLYQRALRVTIHADRVPEVVILPDLV